MNKECRLYNSEDETVLNDPRIEPILQRLRRIRPSPNRPKWHLNPRAWKYGLKDFPEDKGGQSYVDQIIEWNDKGWPVTANTDLKCTGTPIEYNAKIENIAAGLLAMEKRINRNYIWGPFEGLNQLPFTKTNDGFQAKTWPIFYKEESDKVRVLVDLSNTDSGESFNDQLTQEEKTVHYITIITVIQLIVNCNMLWIWYMDALEAYYRVPIQSRFIPYLGVKICGFFFFFTSLVMGLASSCKIYSEFGDVVCWIIIHQYPLIFQQQVGDQIYDLLVHYIDDYFCGHQYKAIAELQFAFVKYWWYLLGIPTQDKKCNPPTQSLRYLGYILHTVRRMLSIPKDRLDKYKASFKMLRSAFLTKSTVQIKTLQKVVGQFRSIQVVYPYIVPFLRSLEAVTSRAPNNRDRVRITHQMMKDIDLIEEAVDDLAQNEMPFSWLLHPKDSNFDVTVYTDASTKIGVGGYIHTEDGKYFQCTWEQTILRKFPEKPDIMYYELLGVVLAARLYGHEWTGNVVHFYCDNWAVCACVARKCACFKRRDLNDLLRVLCKIAISKRFFFWIDHIPGLKNVTADALSRQYDIHGIDKDAKSVNLASKPTKCIKETNEILSTFTSNVKKMKSGKFDKLCDCDHSNVSKQKCCLAQDEVFKLLRKLK